MEWLKKHATKIAFTVPVSLTPFLIYWMLHEALWSTADRTGLSYGEIVRNYGLIIAACWGLPLAVWRSGIAERQVDEQREAVEAQREATTQSDRQHRQSLSQTRLFQAVDLLKDKDETVRKAGARTLGRLVHDEDNPYKEDALRMLEEFVRSHGSVGETEAAKTRTGTEIHPLVQIAVHTVAEQKLPDILRFDLHEINLANASLGYAHLTRANLFDAKLTRAYLGGAHLRGATLFGANLAGAFLTDANLASANLASANLEGAHLISANLASADLASADLTSAALINANLADARLVSANLANADFDRAKGLTQEQLDAAGQRPDGPPPRNLPDGLTWDEEAAKKTWDKEAAKKRWQERRGVQPQR